MVWLVCQKWKATYFRSDIFCPKRGVPREQINGITAFVDGSQIYGSDVDTNIALREEISLTLRDGREQKFPGAKLKTNNNATAAGQMHLPRRQQCRFAPGNPHPTDEDLTAGDVRAIEQPALTAIQTLFLNEHNRIVGELEPLVASNSKTKKLPDYKKQEVVFQVSGIPIIENFSALFYPFYS